MESHHIRSSGSADIESHSHGESAVMGTGDLGCGGLLLHPADFTAPVASSGFVLVFTEVKNVGVGVFAPPRSQTLIRLLTPEFILSRPFKNSISIKNSDPVTFAPKDMHKRSTADAVPPVAKTSSIIMMLSPV